jgi:hypothetical protein
MKREKTIYCQRNESGDDKGRTEEIAARTREKKMPTSRIVKSRSAWIVLCVVGIGAVVVAAVVAAERLRTDRAIERFVGDPSIPLSEGEISLVEEYVLSADISAGRQHQLIGAAFTRESEGNWPLTERVLSATARRWGRDGTFGMLPWMINELIVTRERDLCRNIPDTVPGAPASTPTFRAPRLAIRVDRIIGVVGGVHELGAYLDVEFIMRCCTDADTIWWTASVAGVEVLFAHRSACLEMLRRSELSSQPRLLLLKVIDVSGGGRRWFGKDRELLTQLQRDEDPRVRDAAEKLSEAMNNRSD